MQLVNASRPEVICSPLIEVFQVHSWFQGKLKQPNRAKFKALPSPPLEILDLSNLSFARNAGNAGNAACGQRRKGWFPFSCVPFEILLANAYPLLVSKHFDTQVRSLMYLIWLLRLNQQGITRGNERFLALNIMFPYGMYNSLLIVNSTSKVHVQCGV